MKTITLEKVRAAKGWLPIGARYTYSYKSADPKLALDHARAAMLRDTSGKHPDDVEDPIADWQATETRRTDLRHGDQRLVPMPDPADAEPATTPLEVA